MTFNFDIWRGNSSEPSSSGVKVIGQSSKSRKEDVPFSAESRRVKGKPVTAMWTKSRLEFEIVNK